MHCWKGYKKKGTKKLFGKVVNNCVKESSFDSLVNNILEEGSLLTMAQEVEKRLKDNKIEKFKAIKHLKGLLASSSEIGDKQGIKTILNKLIKEDVTYTHTFRVTHHGLGISEKTTAKDKNEALRNVFGRLKKEGKLQAYQYNQFKDAAVKEV
jgi:hypothetical protein